MHTAAAANAQTEARRAEVETAQLNVDYTTITAPVDGIAGLAKAQIGDLVGPSTGVLTTVSKVDPIKAYFTISEQTYVEYHKRYSDPTERAAHEKRLDFELILADGSTYPQKGELYALENQVDPRTGSIRIAALFPNPGNLLRAGLFARVRVQTDLRKDGLLVPQRAVNELQGMYQLAVVGADNKASIRPAAPRCRPRRRAPAIATHHHDLLRIHPRLHPPSGAPAAPAPSVVKSWAPPSSAACSPPRSSPCS